MRHLVVVAALALALAGCSSRQEPSKVQGAVESEAAGGSSGRAAEGSGGAPAAVAEGAGGAGETVAREECIDGWLRKKGLNEFGDPAGTMYTGGTPLFDEATGHARERIPYLIEKHPELEKACPESP